MPRHQKAIIALLGCLPFFCSGAVAQNATIQMLPPTVANSATACNASNLNGILAFNYLSSGAPTGSAITCSSGTVDPAGNFTGTSLHFHSPQAGIGDVWIGGSNDIAFDGGSDASFFFNNTGASLGGTGFLASGAGASDAVNLWIANNGSVGVGSTGPLSTLDVNGEVRVGNTGASCTSANEGALQYDKNNHAMDVCNGQSWGALGGSGWVAVASEPNMTFSVNCSAAGTSCSRAVYNGNTGGVLLQDKICTDAGYAHATGACISTGDPESGEITGSLQGNYNDVRCVIAGTYGHSPNSAGDTSMRIMCVK